MNIEAARYLTWKACHYFDTTDGEGEELAIMAKVHCSELCVNTVYNLMRVVGVESYTPHTPLERLLREAAVFPLYDAGTSVCAAGNSTTCSDARITTRCSPPKAARSPYDIAGLLNRRHSDRPGYSPTARLRAAP